MTSCLSPENLRLSGLFHINKLWALRHQVNVNEIRNKLTVRNADTGDTHSLYTEDAAFFHVPRYFGLKQWSRESEFKRYLSIGEPIEVHRAKFHPPLSIQDSKFVIDPGTGLVETPFRQKSAVTECLAKFANRSALGCVLCMPCGYGKTVCALYLISQKQRKTLYVVQAENLFGQTIERIRQFLPNIRVGQIQGPPETWQIDNCDIVVAMMQTLYYHRTELKSALTYRFGFVVVDECHHVGAPTFCDVLKRFACAWFLGLSATPQRMDGKTEWISWMIGPTVNVFETNELRRPDIHVQWFPRLPSSFSSDSFVFQLSPFMKTRTRLEAMLMWDLKRRQTQCEMIYDHVLKQLQWSSSYSNRMPQVIIFSSRIFYLCMLSYTLQRRRVTDQIQAQYPDLAVEIQDQVSQNIFYHPEMEQCIRSTFAIENIHSEKDYYRRRKHINEQTKEIQRSYLKYVNEISADEAFLFPMRVLRAEGSSHQYQKLDRAVLFATPKKLGEGADLKTLRVVVSTTSLSSSNLSQLEQVVGRLRLKHETQTIYEFIEYHPLLRLQGERRKKFYESRGMKQYYL